MFMYILIAVLFILCAVMFIKINKCEDRITDLEEEATHMKLDYKGKYKTVENNIADLTDTVSSNYKDFVKMFDVIEGQCDKLIDQANAIIDMAAAKNTNADLGAGLKFSEYEDANDLDVVDEKEKDIYEEEEG